MFEDDFVVVDDVEDVMQKLQLLAFVVDYFHYYARMKYVHIIHKLKEKIHLKF